MRYFYKDSSEQYGVTFYFNLSRVVIYYSKALARITVKLDDEIIITESNSTFNFNQKTSLRGAALNTSRGGQLSRHGIKLMMGKLKYIFNGVYDESR